MRIFADYREKNSLVCAELVSLGSDFEFTDLKVGDYLIGEVVIERKTTNDFVSSIIDKRLFHQLIGLQQFDERLLILEGKNIYDNKMEDNAVRGMLLSVALEYKCPIVFTEDERETALFLHLIRKRQEKTNKPVSLNAKKKNLSFKEQKQFILESFPGVGPAKAKKLLEKFKTIKDTINADESVIEEILKKDATYFKWLVDN